MNNAKPYIVIFVVLLIFVASYFASKKFLTKIVGHIKSTYQSSDLIQNQTLKDGDIIFNVQKTSINDTSKLIFNHCGVIVHNNNNVYVFETNKNAQFVPLKKFIASGFNGHFLVKRLTNSDSVFSEVKLEKLRETIKMLRGKKNDMFFEWTDKNMYNAELVWKIYKQSTNISLCELKKIGDYNLKGSNAQYFLKNRFSDYISPNEIVVTPNDIFNSSLLYTVVNH